MQVVQESGFRQILQDDSLMPLVEQEYNSLSHPLSRMSTPQMCNLASISSRAAQHAPAQAFTWYLTDFSQPCKASPTIAPVQDNLISHILSCHGSNTHFLILARFLKSFLSMMLLSSAMQLVSSSHLCSKANLTMVA